jgi:hypothetical protein
MLNMVLNLNSVPASCKKCGCVFEWHLNNAPFVDSEIVGTCSKCVEKIAHKCIDEFAGR